MKKYTDHSYADYLDPKNHHKAAHRLIEVKHTPTPWTYNKWRILAEPETGIEVIALLATNAESRTPKQEANAAFIVKAVNCHEELVAYVKSSHAIHMGQAHKAMVERKGFCTTCDLIAKAEGR